MKVPLGFLAAALLAICGVNNALAEFAIPECIKPPQEVVVPVDGTVLLQSPAFPEAYPSRSNCGWNVRSEEPGQQVRIECPSFKLTNRNRNGRCFDFLRVNDKRFCGERGPAVVASLLDVDFRSDRRRNSRGFNCSVTTAQAPSRSETPRCSQPPQNIPVAPGNVVFFSSPNYPNNYPNGRCGWRFTPAASNTRLTLSCNDFRMQNRVRKNRCQDFLSVKAKGKYVLCSSFCAESPIIYGKLLLVKPIRDNCLASLALSRIPLPHLIFHANPVLSDPQDTEHGDAPTDHK
ncbi:cubilin-like [Penaeus monodon]|uniref:cubilin-like n=1 Tax=Penaeus monodon TaxID=6687 RepID=UPI0018A73E43|nr:cubilin-like [Penaeus monodon]